jgi:hypothetical protein
MVAVGAPTTCDSTMPWSSSGASSDFDILNITNSSAKTIKPKTIITGQVLSTLRSMRW